MNSPRIPRQHATVGSESENAVDQLSRIIYKTGVFQVNTTDPFVLHSCKISPIYLDNRRLISFPQERKIVVSALVRRAKVLGNFEVISGGETADIPFASWAARELDLPLVYIRKEAKERGTSKRIEGAIEILKGRRVLHISDLITDGGSAKDWVQAIREADGIVENYFAIFDRKQGGEETLRQRGVKLHSLVQLNDEFLKIGIGTSMIQSDYTEIKQYLADPETWARTFILSDPNWIKSKGEKGKLILQNGYPDLIPLL